MTSLEFKQVPRTSNLIFIKGLGRRFNSTTLTVYFRIVFLQYILINIRETFIKLVVMTLTNSTMVKEIENTVLVILKSSLVKPVRRR